MRIQRIAAPSTSLGVIVLLTVLSTQVLASVVQLAPATYTRTLCATSCTTSTITVPNSPNASVTIPATIPGDGSSGAGVQGDAGRDPSVFAGANAVGVGVDVSSSISLQYYFEVFNRNGITDAAVPVTVNGVLSASGMTLSGATWTSTATASLNGKSVSVMASNVVQPSTLIIEKTFNLLTATPYSINLSADVDAQALVFGDAANTVFASVDPTLSVPDGFSIIYSEGILSPVPEPSTWAMIILGFCGLGFMAHRRKRNGPALGVA
jgi:hypothetical protein